MIKVLKFGGTSVADAELIRAAARTVAASRESGTQVVVVVSAMGRTTDELLALAETFGAGAPTRETDQLVAAGETISAAALAIALNAQGRPAISLSGAQTGIAVEGSPSEGRIEGIDTSIIRNHLNAGRVVVVAGFQGVTSDGSMMTLGRGGSDTTAVALAAALEADECLIYSDVEGVHTADPQLVQDTSIHEEVSGPLMAEMAFAGARVMHARAIDLSHARGVALRLAHAARPSGRNTLIAAHDLGAEDLRLVAVAHDLDTARVLVKAPVAASEMLSLRLLETLGELKAPIDLVARSGSGETEFRMGFTMRESDVVRAGARMHELVADYAGELAIDRGVAKASLIGHGLASRPDLTARFLSVLHGAAVSPSWISTTTMRISAVVPAAEIGRVVALLHKEFDLGSVEDSVAGRDEGKAHV